MMHIAERKTKSLFLDKDISSILRKKALIPKRRTYIESQSLLDERQRLQNLQFCKLFFLTIAEQAMQQSTKHWNFVGSFQQYVQNTYQTAYNFMALKQPQIGNSQINLKQEQQPKSLSIPLKMQINKFSSSRFGSSRTETTQAFNNFYIQQKHCYKQIYQKQKERLARQGTNSLVMLAQTSRDSLQQNNDQSPIITQIRSSRMAIENMQKIKEKNMQASIHFKKAVSRSTDKLPSIYDKSDLRVSKGKKTFNFDPSSGKIKDFAFDSNGGLIKIKNKIDNKLEKQQLLLNISINYSPHDELSNFIRHSHDKIRKSIKKAHLSFIEQQGAQKENQIDGLKYREGIIKSLHCKPGVLLKPKAASKKSEHANTQSKLPRI